MKTNHHTETDQRSGTLDDLSYTFEDRKQAEALLAGENRLLEMLATGCTLSEILDALCRLIEDFRERITLRNCFGRPCQQSTEARCSAQPSPQLQRVDPWQTREYLFRSMRHGCISQRTSDCCRCRVGHTMGHIRMACSGNGTRTAGLLVHSDTVIR